MAFNSKYNTLDYRVGVYGPRLVCRRLAEKKISVSSFVADMSRGFSGNLGYPIPNNWAFDQFKEYDFTSSPSFALDKDAYSGRDKGAITLNPQANHNSDTLTIELAQSRIRAARDIFIRNVTKPLNLFSSFVEVNWEKVLNGAVRHYSTPDYDIDVSLKVSETASASLDKNANVHIATDLNGNLSASTESEITSTKADFNLPRYGAKHDFNNIIKAIAVSVKSGNISYTTAMSGANKFSVSINVESDNLSTVSSSISAYVDVSITYTISFHPTSSSKFHVTNWNNVTLTTNEVIEIIGALVVIVSSGLDERAIEQSLQESAAAGVAFMALIVAVGLIVVVH